MEDQTVVIVGAGIAGLAAAAELSQAGVGVTIIEARDRIGGRILTLDEPELNLPIELAAEFIPRLFGILWGLSSRLTTCFHPLLERWRLRAWPAPSWSQRCPDA